MQLVADLVLEVVVRALLLLLEQLPECLVEVPYLLLPHLDDERAQEQKCAQVCALRQKKRRVHGQSCDRAAVAVSSR